MTQDGFLSFRERLHLIGCLAPFEVGLAALGAQAGAGRIHQYAVDLPGQALEALVVLVCNGHGIHVFQAAARQARLELLQPVRGGIQGIQASGIAHGRTQRQGLAACACAEIRHHFSAPGIEQQGQQLRPLILYLNVSVSEQLQAADGGLVRQADAPRRIRSGCCCDAFSLQRFQYRAALGLQDIDAQIQRRRLQQRCGGGVESWAQLRLQRFSQPLGQIVRESLRQGVRLGLVARGQPLLFLGRKSGQQHMPCPGKAKNGQAPLGGAPAAARQPFKQRLLAQDGIDGFCHRGPFTWPQRALFAKISANHRFGRVFKAQQVRRQRRAVV